MPCSFINFLTRSMPTRTQRAFSPFYILVSRIPAWPRHGANILGVAYSKYSMFSTVLKSTICTLMSQIASIRQRSVSRQHCRPCDFLSIFGGREVNTRQFTHHLLGDFGSRPRIYLDFLTSNIFNTIPNTFSIIDFVMQNPFFDCQQTIHTTST